MRCKLSSILDVNYGLIRADSLYEVVEDHFNRPDDQNQSYNIENDFEMYPSTKFVLFTKMKVINTYQQ